MLHGKSFYRYEPGNYRWWQVDNLSVYEAAYENVTFQVNMEEQTVDPVTGVHVAGSFNGWSASATELLDPDMDDIYEVIIPLIPGIES